MDTDTLVARGQGLVEAEVDGELIGLHVERGSCYGFNATATEIWHLLEHPRTFGSLCAAMLAEHEVDPATCATDVAALLTTLSGEGLVTLAPAGR